MTEPKIIKSVVKAIDLLDVLAEHPEGLGATDVADLLGQRVSGIFHLLTTLNGLDIIRQDDKKRYHLGLKLWQLGQKVSQEDELTAKLLPILKDLRDQTGETANLTIRQGDEILYIAQVSSQSQLKSFTQLGATAPLYCTGAGKVLWAYSPDNIKQWLLDHLELIPYTSNTITSKSELEKELEEIVLSGVGFDHEEREIGVSCIGAPIFGHFDQAIACLSISGPTSRFTPEKQTSWPRIIKLLAETASRLITSKEISP